uniref:Putative secreted protein n=1 Tax=Anopheles marajoara TaxID=58244 RepID=A0A2M4CD05_9DIPT
MYLNYFYFCIAYFTYRLFAYRCRLLLMLSYVLASSYRHRFSLFSIKQIIRSFAQTTTSSASLTPAHCQLFDFFFNF